MIHSCICDWLAHGHKGEVALRITPRSTQLVHEYTCAHAAGEVMGGRQGFRWDLDSVEVQTVYVSLYACT